jgi:tRNA G18 (ribose-2'-O)-methylase SpoU
VGIYHTKDGINVGTLWRSAANFGAAFVFTIGKRYKRQSSDTMKTPRHTPLFHYKDFDAFQATRPHDCQLVSIENQDSTGQVPGFYHPERAIYLLGAEDHGVPKPIRQESQHVIEIPCESGCFNVAVAGSIVMYDRMRQGWLR